MTVCNSCRYCEGLCAVFPAMEMRRAFPDGDLNYLANLCHSCGACYVDCQFSPPHEFDVNVPRVLAQVRAESYAAYAWPRFLAPMFARNGLAISLVAALSVAAFILGFAAWHDARGAVRHAYRAGRVLPTDAAQRDGVRCSASSSSMRSSRSLMGVRAFWRDIGDPIGGSGRARCGRRSATPARCAISMAAASAATITTSGRTTAAGSIITRRSTASCSVSRRPAWRRSITTRSAAWRRIRGGTCRWCSAPSAASG